MSTKTRKMLTAYEVGQIDAAIWARRATFIRTDSRRPLAPATSPPSSRRQTTVPSGGGGGVTGAEPYRSAAERLLRGSRCAVRQWTRSANMPAFAWSGPGRLIDAPKPTHAAATALLAHEAMHHVHGLSGDEVRDEVDSWRAVLQWWDAEGLPNRRAVVQTACSRLRSYDPGLAPATAAHLLAMPPGSTLALGRAGRTATRRSRSRAGGRATAAATMTLYSGPRGRVGRIPAPTAP